MRTVLAAVAASIVALAACTAAAPSGPPSASLRTSTSAPTPSPVATVLPSAGSSPLAPTGRIAFLRPEMGDGSGRVDIYVVDAAGGTPIRLTNDSRVEQAIFWQLDGSRLLYAWATFEDPYHQILTSIRADGTDSRDLGPVQTAYSSPPVSPDGRYVVFGGDGSSDGSSGLVLLDLREGTRRQLTTDGGTEPIWSPDGSHVLALLPSRGIDVVDPATGKVLTSLADPNVQWLVGWTRDGSSFLYHDCGPDLGKTQCIDAPTLAADLDGTHVRVYAGPMQPPTDCSVTVWSPDSNWLVYTDPGTEPDGDEPSQPGHGLFIVRGEGGSPIQLTDGPYDGAAAWGRG